MIKIMARKGSLTDIGYLGENEHRVICFHDSIELLKQYPDAGVTVLHKRSEDETAYPVPPQYVSIQNGIVEWTVQSGDLTMAGPGKCELIFTENGVIAKTMIYDTICKTSLDGAGDPPEPWEGWIEHVTQTAAEIAADKEATIEAANEAAAAKEETVAAKQAALTAQAAAEAAKEETVAAKQAALTAQAAAEAAKEIAARRASDAQSAALMAENKAQNATEAAERSTNMAWNAGQSAGNAQQNRWQAYTHALEAEGLANGTQGGTPVESGSPYFENNARYYAGLTHADAQAAKQAKDQITGMSATAQTLAAGSAATASYANGVLTIGVPRGTDGTNGTDGDDGVTFTPAVSAAGVLSWSNDGGRTNPQSVDVAAAVRGSIDVAVSGTTPMITGAANHYYKCGTVSTIVITAPASGHFIVVFTSGTTAAVMTATGVTWPEWFTPDALEAGYTYEISVMDGRGAVMAWPT